MMHWLRSPIAIARIALVIAMIGAATSPPLANVGVVVALLAALTSADARAQARAHARDPVFVTVGALLLVLVAWCAVGDATPAERIAKVFSWRHALIALVGYCVYFDASARRGALLAWVAFAGLGAIVSLVAWRLGITPPAEIGPGIVLRNHTIQSMVFGSAIVCGAALLVHGHTRGALRIAVALATLLSGVALLASTYGRSGFIVVALGGGWLLVDALRRRGLRALAPALIAMAVVTGLGAAVFGARVVAMFEGGMHELEHAQTDAETSEREISMVLRYAIYSNALAIVQAHPWLGVGTGGFASAYRAVAATHPTGMLSWPKRDPHNQYLFVLAEHGPIGLIVFVAMLVAFWRAGARPGDERAVGRGLLLGWAATSLFTSHFSTFSEGLMIWVWLGVLFAPDRPPAAATGTTIGRPA